MAEMCKKELQKLLPIIVYDEVFCAMALKVIEDIKIKQAKDAQSNVQARQRTLGYNRNSISVSDTSSSVTSSSVTAPLLVVASQLFDRGQKRKT